MYTGTSSANADTRNTLCMYSSTFNATLDSRRDAREEPIMEANMKVAKMKPCGMSWLLGLRAGVQRNTNVYMDPSNRDWMAPRRAIFSSDRWAEMVGNDMRWFVCCCLNLDG